MNNSKFKLNKSNLIQFTAIISTLVINLVSYPFLPDKVGIQVNASGISNSAPKLLYLSISFLAISLLAYLGSKPIGQKKNQYTGVAILLVFFNLITIILNIIFLT